MTGLISLDHLHYLDLALEQAELAVGEGALPVGAVIVASDGLVISRGRNAVIPRGDPTAHAEIEAIRNAGDIVALGSSGGNMALYTSAEPCLMCLGAIVVVPSIAAVSWATGSDYTSAYRALLSTGYQRDRLGELVVIAEPSASHGKRSRALMREFYLRQGDSERAKLMEETSFDARRRE